jgi:hypothetical protein
MDVKYLPQMQDESSRRYLFVAIDRATRWVFVQFKAKQDSGQCQGLSQSTSQGLPDQDQQAVDRQRQGVHRPTVCQPGARTQRQP